jgi:uncharacterized protein (TIGR03067 family)
MLRFVIISSFAVLCLATQQDEAVKKEMKLFQGKWEGVSGQGLDGKAYTDIEAQLMSMEIDGDKFTMKTGSLTVSGTFTVDPTKKLKTIDVFFGDGKEPSLRGIYEIKGDTRKSCFAEPGKDRPDGFHKEKKGFMILEWRQVK